MKFIRLGIVSLLIIGSISLIGCNNKNSTFEKAVEEGKLSLANKDFEISENLFSLALSEKEDKEIKKLYEQIKLYNLLVDLIDDDSYDIEQAIDIKEKLLGDKDLNNIIKKEVEKIELESNESVENEEKTKVDNSTNEKEREEKAIESKQACDILPGCTITAEHGHLPWEIYNINQNKIDGGIASDDAFGIVYEAKGENWTFDESINGTISSDNIYNPFTQKDGPAYVFGFYDDNGRKYIAFVWGDGSYRFMDVTDMN